MKLDPYKHEERYVAWKSEALKKGISGISKENSDLLLKYVQDMEFGLNVSATNKKGARSYIRLNNLRQRMVFLTKQFHERYNLSNLTQLTEVQIHDYFSGMRSGRILRQDGKPYKSVVDYVKVFKAFWHWWQKLNRKEGIAIEDITIDLDTSKTKPEWVYLSEEQVRSLYNNAKYSYKVLIMFLFDTGIRAPTELMNIRVSDFLHNYSELNIREEVSKTFGRRIKLMLCGNLIKEYIATENLGPEDYVFRIDPTSVNQYLKRLATRILGDKKSLAGQKYSELTMYDFRHCACCYWLPRYKSESALKFRFGWKESDKIHYYSEMLGMRDTINEDDMLVDIKKTELEQRLLSTEKENKLLKERLTALEAQMNKILSLMKRGMILTE